MLVNRYITDFGPLVYENNEVNDNLDISRFRNYKLLCTVKDHPNTLTNFVNSDFDIGSRERTYSTSIQTKDIIRHLCRPFNFKNTADLKDVSLCLCNGMLFCEYSATGEFINDKSLFASFALDLNYYKVEYYYKAPSKDGFRFMITDPKSYVFLIDSTVFSTNKTLFSRFKRAGMFDNECTVVIKDMHSKFIVRKEAQQLNTFQKRSMFAKTMSNKYLYNEKK